MRAGASTVQQTLTPEAAAILKHAVAEACRRGHAQATPLHVAATLLGAPGSPLRRACLQTHPQSPHLPHCRALELCFNIALDRLQAAQGPLPGGQPSYSNALVAALKRAQAHQRRGCPEQQQQPLLAVKVELEQLVISILDDPSVSRVMREAGFSSTDVKNHLEEMVSLMSSHHAATNSSTDQARLSLGAAIDQMGLRLSAAPSFLSNITLPQHLSYNGLSLERNDTQLHLRPARTASLYMNPRFQKSGGAESLLGGGDDLKRVFEILLRRKRRNPVLVADSGTIAEARIRELVHRMERGDVPGQLQGVKLLPAQLHFVSLMSASKEALDRRFIELNNAVNELMSGGVIIYLGDLQWLLDSSQVKSSVHRPPGFCPVQYAAFEIQQLLARHQDSGRIWLIGTATSHTYVSCCQVQPMLESQWDLQPVSIASSGPSVTLPSRYRSQEAGGHVIDPSLTLSLHPSLAAALKINPPVEDRAEKPNLCSECMAKYEKEALLLHEQETNAQSESPQSCSSSVENSSKDTDNERQLGRPASTTQPMLPLWLQKALPATGINKSESAEANEKVVPLAYKLQELRKKWNQTCHTLHVHHFAWSNISCERLQQPSPSSSQISGGSSARCQSFEGICCPSTVGLPWQALSTAAPVTPSTEAATPGITCASEQNRHPVRMFGQMDPDAFKGLCKGLAERVSWQKGVVSTIADTVMRCRAGMGKQRGVSLRSDVWLLFLGSDKAGKKKMAEALAELIFGSDKRPICLTLGSHQELSSSSVWSLGLQQPVLHGRGKMPWDRLAEAVRQNPFSVILLEDVDQADSMFKSNLIKAMEKGRLPDSNGRDVSFSSVIIVMTTNCGTDSVDPGITESKMQPGKGTFTIDSGEHANAENGHLENAPSADEHLSSGSTCKRKAEWNVEDELSIRPLGSLSKKTNLGRALDLDLNMSAEENETVDCSGCDITRENGESRRLEFNEEVLLSARKHLGEFCNLADAAVVFCPAV